MAKNCWLSRYKTSSSNKVKYMFVPSKTRQKTINQIRKKYLKKYWTKK